MAFKKTFVVSTEKINTHGFIVDNEGLDIALAQQNCPAFYDHDYTRVPFGHWENIRKEGTLLKADLVIDGKSEEEREMIRKIENGDVKGASIGADPQEWGYRANDGTMVKCLKKSELFEISLTPLPSNTASLALKHDGVAVRLSGLAKGIVPDNTDTYEQNTISNMKTIAVKLGLNENASETEILDAVGILQNENKQNKSIATEIIEQAKEGLTEEQVGVLVTLSKADAKQALNYAKSIKEAVKGEAENGKQGNAAKLTKDVKVSELLNRKGAAADDGKDTFDYLSKHDKAELARIRQEEPEKYAQLTRDYGKGVRYKTK